MYSLTLGLSEVFLMVILGSWVCGRKATEVKCPFHSVLARVPDIDKTCHCQCRPRFPSPGSDCQAFSHEITLLFHFHAVLPRRKSPAQSPLRAGEGDARPRGWSSCINHLELCYMGDSPLSPPFTWAVFELHWYGLRDIPFTAVVQSCPTLCHPWIAAHQAFMPGVIIQYHFILFLRLCQLGRCELLSGPCPHWA